MDRAAEHDVETYPHWPIDGFVPDLPDGHIERIYTHWSAHDYACVFPAYHFCVAQPDHGEIVVVNTHDVRENMRNVYDAPEKPYAAHTRGRNSFAIGISVMGMEGATPADFGRYPLTEPLIDALCLVGAKLAKFYRVPLDADHCMSHAEAALHDGYFGLKPEERWDIARLAQDPRPLEARDGIETGELLRARMRAHFAQL